MSQRPQVYRSPWLKINSQVGANTCQCVLLSTTAGITLPLSTVSLKCDLYDWLPSGSASQRACCLPFQPREPTAHKHRRHRRHLRVRLWAQDTKLVSVSLAVADRSPCLVILPLTSDPRSSWELPLHDPDWWWTSTTWVSDRYKTGTICECWRPEGLGWGNVFSGDDPQGVARIQSSLDFNCHDEKR